MLTELETRLLDNLGSMSEETKGVRRLVTHPKLSEGTNENRRIDRFTVDEPGFFTTRENQMCLLLRRRQTPVDYRESGVQLTEVARRPVQPNMGRSSLRIEFCVVYSIGRSPTQVILCHRSNGKCKNFEKYFCIYLWRVIHLTWNLSKQPTQPEPCDAVAADDLGWRREERAATGRTRGRLK